MSPVSVEETKDSGWALKSEVNLIVPCCKDLRQQSNQKVPRSLTEKHKNSVFSILKIDTIGEQLISAENEIELPRTL